MDERGEKWGVGWGVRERQERERESPVTLALSLEEAIGRERMVGALLLLRKCCCFKDCEKLVCVDDTVSQVVYYG